MHALSLGKRDGGMSERVQAIAAAMRGAKLDVYASGHIVQRMWDRWAFLATLAGGTKRGESAGCSDRCIRLKKPRHCCRDFARSLGEKGAVRDGDARF
jgi:hypothetical protein